MNVPNPMASIPPSPAPSPLPLEFASPSGFAEFVDDVDGGDAKRARRSEADAVRETPSPASPAPPPHRGGHPPPASKASSSSLASHPSHASFGSAQTDGSGALRSFAPGSAPAPTATADRRLKRLERNRESARLSRKRRKAYLEELEARVHALSGRADRERCRYALGFLDALRKGREGLLSGDGLSGLSDPSTTRLPSALRVILSFLHAHASSLVVSKEAKFVLWLMLQKERFWRGGRGTSERLSAARIGEKMLHSGTYRASPSEGMWPLFCHEVGLSYEQEDRVRTAQRAVLADAQTWIHRHTGAATKNVVDSIHTAIGGMHETAKRREESLLEILTPEQRVKFLSWASRKSSAIRQLAQSRIGPSNDSQDYALSPDRHIAANMYVIDHRLSKVKTRLPPVSSIVHPSALKKLSRRPSFESLAGQEACETNSKLNRDSSFPSTGSLKRSLHDAVGDENHPPTSAYNGVTPESAQAAAREAVTAALRDILPIVPPSHLPRVHPASFSPCAGGMSHQYPLPAPSPIRTTSEALYAEAFSSVDVPMPPQSSLPVEPPPPAPTDDIDIPMPTPVSVLLRTQDEFISPYDVESSHAPIEAISWPQQQQTPAIKSGFLPAPVSSDAHIRPSSRAYQSAPQLYAYAGEEFDYLSLMPSTMIPVPEESLMQNPMLNEDGLSLDGLPLPDPNDWAIGESFDMDVDSNRGSTS